MILQNKKQSTISAVRCRPIQRAYPPPNLHILDFTQSKTDHSGTHRWAQPKAVHARWW